MSTHSMLFCDARHCENIRDALSTLAQIAPESVPTGITFDREDVPGGIRISLILPTDSSSAAHATTGLNPTVRKHRRLAGSGGPSPTTSDGSDE